MLKLFQNFVIFVMILMLNTEISMNLQHGFADFGTIFLSEFLALNKFLLKVKTSTMQMQLVIFCCMMYLLCFIVSSIRGCRCVMSIYKTYM